MESVQLSYTAQEIDERLGKAGTALQPGDTPTLPPMATSADVMRGDLEDVRMMSPLLARTAAYATRGELTLSPETLPGWDNLFDLECGDFSPFPQAGFDGVVFQAYLRDPMFATPDTPFGIRMNGFTLTVLNANGEPFLGSLLEQWLELTYDVRRGALVLNRPNLTEVMPATPGNLAMFFNFGNPTPVLIASPLSMTQVGSAVSDTGWLPATMFQNAIDNGDVAWYRVMGNVCYLRASLTTPAQAQGGMGFTGILPFGEIPFAPQSDVEGVFGGSAAPEIRSRLAPRIDGLNRTPTQFGGYQFGFQLISAYSGATPIRVGYTLQFVIGEAE